MVGAAGGSVDVASGAGYTGAAADRKIINNKFTADGAAPYWALVSFNGIVPSVGWFTYPVGGATVTGVDYDLLTVNGSAALDGTLTVLFTNGYTGADGDERLTQPHAVGDNARTLAPARPSYGFKLVR